MNPTREYRETLTPAQVEKAALASPHLYPQNMPCARCSHLWMTHNGLLCPMREGQVSNIVNPLTGQPYVTPPVYGNQTFIPDEDYYKPPDFEVM